MTDEHKLRRDSGRGARAKSLLDSELLQEAFKTLEDSYTAAWRASPAADTAYREKLFLAINVIGKVREHLDTVVTNGKLAAAELKALADVAERKRLLNFRRYDNS